MKLEEQVVSLELAKKLKELGVKQESYFKWCVEVLVGDSYEHNKTHPELHSPLNAEQIKHMKSMHPICAAFTVAELLHISPASTSILKRTDLETNSIPRYYVETFEHYRESDWHENPANALARMLIYLLENKLI